MLWISISAAELDPWVRWGPPGLLPTIEVHVSLCNQEVIYGVILCHPTDYSEPKNLPLQLKMFNQTLIKHSNLTSSLQETEQRNKLNHTTRKKPDNLRMHFRLQMTGLDSRKTQSRRACLTLKDTIGQPNEKHAQVSQGLVMDLIDSTR